MSPWRVVVRCSPTPPKTRDEALAELAARYFLSRGPATLQDFIWWSGLSAAEARCGHAAIQSQLVAETVGKLTYWLPADSRPPKAAPSAFALPGFDEYLLGYKDRSAVLDAAHAAQICPGGNGMFAATMVIDGRVAGTWRRVVKKNGIDITAAPFARLNPADAQRFDTAAQRYGAYQQLPVRVV